MALAAELLQRRAAVQNAPRWKVRLLATFQPAMREQLEMLYQYETAYEFRSGKLETAFGLAPTPYRQGFRHALGEADG